VTSLPTLAAALESALNVYLKQVPNVEQRTAALQGKVIALSVTGTNLTLYFLPAADGVQILGHYEGDIDTHLSGSPLGFARLVLGRREDALFQGAVRIEGDTDIGQQFQELLAGADWDWEEHLSRISGDVIAHQAGTLVRQARRFLDDSRTTLVQDCSEYLQEEARLLPTRIEVEYFFGDVDRMRDAVSRMEARVERLLRAADKPS
jgi:ubiquinone biosynthesis protein UbiJ